jgi:hypothetical protein
MQSNILFNTEATNPMQYYAPCIILYQLNLSLADLQEPLLTWQPKQTKLPRTRPAKTALTGGAGGSRGTKQVTGDSNMRKRRGTNPATGDSNMRKLRGTKQTTDDSSMLERQHPLPTTASKVCPLGGGQCSG